MFVEYDSFEVCIPRFLLFFVECIPQNDYLCPVNSLAYPT